LSVRLGIKRARGAADWAVNEEYTALTEAVIVISNFAITVRTDFLMNLKAALQLRLVVETANGPQNDHCKRGGASAS
jgi:hypothetical protein